MISLAALFRCYFGTLFTTKCFRQIHQGDSGGMGRAERTEGDVDGGGGGER